MSNILVEACVANLIRRAATASGSLGVIDLSQLRRQPAGVDTIVEIMALGADLMFQWWPNSTTAAITTINAAVSLSAGSTIVELPVAEVANLQPGFPIEVEETASSAYFRGTVCVPNLPGAKRVKNSDIESGAGTIFAIAPQGTIALTSGKNVQWQRPVFDSSGKVYYGREVKDTPAAAKRFAVPKWANALAFIRTASTDVTCQVTQLQ